MNACNLVRAAIAFGLFAATPFAEAQGRQTCAARDHVVSRLAERYGETRQSMGLNQDQGLIEVYASDDTGSWTILLTRPDGTTCLLASGELWEADATPVGKPGNPA